MVTEKVMRFQGKNKELEDLSRQISTYLESEGYKVQSTSFSSASGSGFVVQAKKENILRDIITADRCFTITLTGQPNDFTVKIGIGKWIQNVAVAIVEAAILSAFFLAVDVPEMLWNVHVENTIAKKITQLAS
ncbi:MAG TPA: hypothetical protein VED86_07210 [archaeon]|nr:hypothetical protein [archaeon]